MHRLDERTDQGFHLERVNGSEMIRDAIALGLHRDDWVDTLDPREHADTVFYLAGYIPGVVDLRRRLRRKGVAGSRVKTQGFWD